MDQKIRVLQNKLKDERGEKVIFLSHCLLNENTRYLGGATRRGGVDEIIDELQGKGIGMVQMKCPEQKAWGGVLKKEMLRGYGAKSTPNFFRNLYFSSFLKKTKKIYRLLAKEVADEIEDYLGSGFKVVGIVGIKGSPSCGVSAALDLKKSADFAANLNIEELNKENFNETCYKNCLMAKEGLFIDALKLELKNRKIEVRFFEHDLLAELKGEKSNINFGE